MKKWKGPTTSDWIANVIDAEDLAIRKRQGLVIPLTPAAYAVWEHTMENEYDTLRRQYRDGTLRDPLNGDAA